MKRKKQTVFVVDDDPAARRSLAALIESHGPRVTTFSSAEDLIERYIATLDPRSELARSTADHPDCIVCDLRMTGMNGVELQETLAERGLARDFDQMGGVRGRLTGSASRIGPCDVEISKRNIVKVRDFRCIGQHDLSHHF